MIYINMQHLSLRSRARSSAVIGEVRIHIYSGSARLISFEIRLISKEIKPERECMNMHLPN